MSWTWNEMLEEFRALGGVADNVALRSGRYGRGLFPENAGEPVRLYAPKTLLAPVDEVEFRGDDLVIKAESAMGERERAFVERYQQAFSWGAGGRADCETFLERLAAIPTPLRDALNKELGLEFLFKGHALVPSPVASRYLSSRMITHQGRHVLMPVLDLANHTADGPLVDMKNGASLTGTFAEEIRFRYAVCDPLTVFVGWGFASPEVTAFSLPLTIKSQSRTLVIKRRLEEAVAKGRFRAPTVTIEGDAITVSHMMLGHRGMPKLAKTMFYSAVRAAGVADPESLFDQVAHQNRQRFLTVLDILEDRPGDLVADMRRMARFQLRSMSFAVGERPAADPTAERGEP